MSKKNDESLLLSALKVGGGAWVSVAGMGLFGAGAALATTPATIPVSIILVPAGIGLLYTGVKVMTGENPVRFK